jgi:hypothetical protein
MRHAAAAVGITALGICGHAAPQAGAAQIVAEQSMSARFSGIQSLPVQTHASPEQLMHTQTSFDMVVKAGYAETFPLFGPEGERAWAGRHWDPQFVSPQPARDAEGAVFTISHGSTHAVWVVTQFDREARRIQYAYVIPNILATKIDVRFESADAGTTRVHVEYERTALSAEGNEHVAAMTEGDKGAGRVWQEAIDSYLAARKTAGQP